MPGAVVPHAAAAQVPAVPACHRAHCVRRQRAGGEIYGAAAGCDLIGAMDEWRLQYSTHCTACGRIPLAVLLAGRCSAPADATGAVACSCTGRSPASTAASACNCRCRCRSPCRHSAAGRAAPRPSGGGGARPALPGSLLFLCRVRPPAVPVRRASLVAACSWVLWCCMLGMFIGAGPAFRPSGFRPSRRAVKHPPHALLASSSSHRP